MLEAFCAKYFEDNVKSAKPILKPSAEGSLQVSHLDFSNEQSLPMLNDIKEGAEEQDEEEEDEDQDEDEEQEGNQDTEEKQDSVVEPLDTGDNYERQKVGDLVHVSKSVADEPEKKNHTTEEKNRDSQNTQEGQAEANCPKLESQEGNRRPPIKNDSDISEGPSTAQPGQQNVKVAHMLFHFALPLLIWYKSDHFSKEGTCARKVRFC